MAKIFDREDEPNDFMEMPCRCDCGKWFDLNDGYSSERQKNKVICGECGEKEEKEIDLEEEIASWKYDYQNAKDDMEVCAKMLKQLGTPIDASLSVSPEELIAEAESLYPYPDTRRVSDDDYRICVGKADCMRAAYIQGRSKTIAREKEFAEWVLKEKVYRHPSGQIFRIENLNYVADDINHLYELFKIAPTNETKSGL